MSKIPFKKKLIFNVFKKLRETEIELHDLTYLFWECTLRCNLNCIHCGSDCSHQSSVPDMPIADFLKVTEKIRGVYQPEKVMVVITGGEPLMRQDLETCGMELSKQGFKWGIVTNGVLLSKSRLESLVKAGLSSVTVSLDGLQQNHNWMRNSDSFHQVVKAIKLIAQNEDLVFDVVTCVNQKNFDELEGIKTLLLGLHVKKWRLFTISPIGRAKDLPDLKLRDSQFVGLMEFIKKARIENRLDVNYECEGFVGNYELEVRKGLYFCRAGINIASVLIDGSISACPNIDRQFAQGNIYQDDFLEVWNDKFEIMRQRDWMKCGECSECEVFKWCTGNGMHLRDFETKEVLACQYHTLERESYKVN